MLAEALAETLNSATARRPTTSTATRLTLTFIQTERCQRSSDPVSVPNARGPCRFTAHPP